MSIEHRPGLVNIPKAMEMVIKIVDLPIEHGDFPVRYVTVYQRVPNAKKINTATEKRNRPGNWKTTMKD